MEFLEETQHWVVSEVSLKVLEHLLARGWGWRLVQHAELVDMVILLTHVASQPRIQVLALAVLDQVGGDGGLSS